MLKRAFALMIAAVIAFAAAPHVRGNAGPPRPKPDKDNNFVIELDPNAKEVRLIVPKKLATSRAALDLEPGDARVADEPRSDLHSVVAGTALTLALSCSGLWLVRRNRAGGKSLALLIAAGMLFAGGVAVYADIPGPGPRSRPQAPPIAALQQLYSGKITVEISDKVEVVKLILPPDGFKKLMAPPGGGAPLLPPGFGNPPPTDAPPKKSDYQ